ncbi:MAG: hypothetical protein JJU36_01580 [Phycisphaeraceae bacterium]|nr:hypothetical protein [Phycisphaeraceae bacterium]
MTRNQLAQHLPFLLTVVPQAARESIRLRGLLSAEQLINTGQAENGNETVHYRWAGESIWLESTARLLCSMRRDQNLEIRAGQEIFTLRDQHPIGGAGGENAIARVLTDDLAPADWFRILNSRAYFFPCANGYRQLCEAGQRFRAANNPNSTTLLILKTTAMPDTVFARLQGSFINGGVINGNAHRGLGTYRPMAHVDIGEASRLREITIVGGVSVDELYACTIEESWFRNPAA